MDLLTSLAGELSLGGILGRLATRGGWTMIDHFTQGEFHHDVVVRASDPELPAAVLVVSTNCNGGRLGPSLAAGAATSAIAYVADYHVVPKRFTPGFEKRLSGGALATVYGVLALALGAGLYLGKKQKR
jgi:hypothetical protein